MIQKVNRFSLQEFFSRLSPSETTEAVRDADLQLCLYELWARLNIIRAILGKPIIINSWYRDEQHNARVGGSPTSQHLRGQAVDIKAPDATLQELLTAISKSIEILNLEYGQIIVYRNQKFIHISLPTAKHSNEFIYK